MHQALRTRRAARQSAWMLAAAASGAAHAQAEPALPLWEVGAFGLAVSQQAYPGSSVQVKRALALPFGLYRGRVLRADRGSAGLRAIKTDTVEVDVGFAGAFGSDADDIQVREGMPDLGTLIEFGPRLKWTLGAAPAGGVWRAELPLRGVFDVSDGFAHRGIAFEPELVWELRDPGQWTYNASVGAVLGNRKLADTFYGVAPAFATAGRPAYEADAGLISWRLGVSFSRRVAHDWRIFGFARFDTVAGAANRDSPLVDRTSGGSVGFGLAWTWLRSDRPAAD